MVGEAAQKKLYNAAREGDLATFKQMLQKDPCLLDEISFPRSRNLLHIATMHGKTSIVEEVLTINPELARDVDSTKSSSLHIAAAQGNVVIASKLLSKAPQMCWWLDDQGMNPIHIAAMKGNEDVLKKLIEHDSLPAMERVHHRQTVMHLCVKHRQLGALKVLVEKLGDLVAAKDEDGETLLHLAVRSNQVEMIKYLVEESNTIEMLTPNSTGKTALAVLHENPPQTNYSKIRRMLVCLSDQSILQSLHKMTDMTLVVVVLIATMAFQAAVSPPGGVWQDNTSPHKAGKAVIASINPTMYKHFRCANTAAFVSSLITIFIVTTSGPSQHFFFLTIATYGMWVSMASIAVAYGASLIMTNPLETHSFDLIVAIVVLVFIGVFAYMFGYLAIVALYSSWMREHRQQNDFRVRIISLIFSRDLHQLFQLFNSSAEDTFLRIRILFGGVCRVVGLRVEECDKVGSCDVAEGVGEEMGDSMLKNQAKLEVNTLQIRVA